MNGNESRLHERAMESLPWLVNGTLPDDEAAALRAHVETCVVCRREFEAVEALQSGLAAQDVPGGIPAPDMRRINRRIDADLERRTPFAGIADGLRHFFRRPLHIAVAIQAGIIAVLLVALLRLDEPPAEFTTLTEGPQLAAGDYLRVVVDGSVDDDRWQALLDDHRLVVRDPRSAHGVATLAFADGTSAADREVVLASLESHPDIRFVQALTVSAP